MRTIRKGSEPRELAEYRQSPDAAYDGYRLKDELRKQLVAEQRGLCCYCMSELRDKVKIEHWRPQREKHLQLVYSNLLASCHGGEGRSPRFQHCDTSKGNGDLSRNPADPAHNVGAIVWFETDGRIRSTNPVFDAELNNVLNLNAKHIVDDRKQALRAFRSIWRSRPKKDLRRQLERLRDDVGTTALPAYSQVIFLWLENQIGKC